MGYYYLWQYVHDTINTFIPKQYTSSKSTQVVVSDFHLDRMNLSRAAGQTFIRLAGLSGAVAVAMGAYGNHVFFKRQDVPNELKEVYKTGNYYHFLHTLALLAIPLTRHPRLVGSLMSAGMLLFCGTCYVYALTGHNVVVHIAPYGGTLLIISWLSMML